MNAVKHAAVGQHVGRWTFWDIVLRDAIMYEIIWGWGLSNISLVCHLYFLVSACMCKFLMHTLVIYMHEHNHGTPSGCPHKHILSQGAHWVLTWLLTWLLTYYSLDYSLGTHLVLTGCSLGAHWPNLAARPWCIYRVAPQFPTMKNMHFAAEGYQKIDVPEHRMVYNICCERNTTPAKHFETRLKRIRNALKNFCNAFVTLV